MLLSAQKLKILTFGGKKRIRCSVAMTGGEHYLNKCCLYDVYVKFELTAQVKGVPFSVPCSVEV